jgi:hypothetical protein
MFTATWWGTNGMRTGILATGRILACLCFTTVTWAQVGFNKLTQCEDIRSIWSELRSGDPHFAQRCGPPSGPFERMISNSLSGSPMADFCFISTPPAPFLKGFQCVYTWSSPESSGLDCLRGISGQGVADYLKHHEDTYKNDVVSYLSRAAACVTDGGDATVAPRSIASGLASHFSDFQFGFVLTARGQTEGMIAVHGFANIDKSKINTADDSIEFVNLFTGPTPNPKLRPGPPWEQIGHWSVQVDPANDAATITERGIRAQTHIRVVVGIRAFSIKRTSDDYNSEAEKRRNLREWQDALAKSLMRNDFEKATEEQLRQAGVPPTAQLRDRLNSAISSSFGRDARIRVGDDLMVLENTWSPRCTKKGGGFNAMIFPIDPQPLIKEDNGGVFLMVMGLLSCGSEDLRDHVRDLLDDAEAELKKSLR